MPFDSNDPPHVSLRQRLREVAAGKAEPDAEAEKLVTEVSALVEWAREDERRKIMAVPGWDSDRGRVIDAMDMGYNGVQALLNEVREEERAKSCPNCVPTISKIAAASDALPRGEYVESAGVCARCHATGTCDPGGTHCYDEYSCKMRQQGRDPARARRYDE